VRAVRGVPVPAATMGRMTDTTAPASTWPSVKVARAVQHLADLQARVGLWHATRPYRIEDSLSDDRLTWSLRLRVSSLPPLEEWGAYMGDCVHNLRSALDAAAWDGATAEGREPMNPTQIGFPIATTPKEWDRQVGRGKLDCVPPEMVARIRSIQPFTQPAGDDIANGLALVSKLDNNDKHRSKLVASIEWTDMAHELTFEYASGAAAARNVPPNTTLHTPEIVDGALLIENSGVDPIVGVKGESKFGMQLRIDTPFGALPLFPTLGSLVDHVAAVLAIVYDRPLPFPPTADGTS